MDILSFCKRFKKIFIYGHGIYGKRIEQFLSDEGVPICGFIVSKVTEDEKNTTDINHACVDDEAGIIVALNMSNYNEARGLIENKFHKNQLLVAEY